MRASGIGESLNLQKQKKNKKEMISEIPKLCGLALAYLTIISIMVRCKMILCTVYIESF